MKKVANTLYIAGLLAAAASIIGIAIGVLATPIVLAMTVSWHWLFLYLGYLIAIFLVTILVLATQQNEVSKRTREGTKNEKE